MSKLKPILRTEQEAAEYHTLRNQFAATALSTMGKHITGWGGAKDAIPDTVMQSLAENAYKLADAMLVAGGQFKFEKQNE